MSNAAADAVEAALQRLEARVGAYHAYLRHRVFRGQFPPDVDGEALAITTGEVQVFETLVRNVSRLYLGTETPPADLYQPSDTYIKALHWKAKGNDVYWETELEYYRLFRLWFHSVRIFLSYLQTIGSKGSGGAETTKILFLASDPVDAVRLRLGAEVREIRNRLQAAGLREQFELLERFALRPGDLVQALLDVHPTVVHFSGHGSASGELCFEDDSGVSHLVRPQAFASLFRLVKDTVRVVLLNACYSEDQAKAIAADIPFVVGMRAQIGDEAAIAFATGFYRALGAGRNVPDCFQFALSELQLLNIAEDHIPVLHQRGA